MESFIFVSFVLVVQDFRPSRQNPIKELTNLEKEPKIDNRIENEILKNIPAINAIIIELKTIERTLKHTSVCFS